MNHEQLNTFIKAMESGSFNKAAENLFVSPSAIMRQVNRLEEELELKLFDRTSKGIKPTVAGEYYYQEIVRWNNEYEGIVKKTKEIAKDTKIQNTIRVGVSGTLSERFTKEYWGKIQKEFPEIKFEFISYGIFSENVMPLVNDVGIGVDIVIDHYEPWAIEEYDLGVVQLYESQMSCAVSVNSDLYMKEKLQMEDLYGRTVSVWNIKSSSTYRDMRNVFKKYPEINMKDIPFEDVNAFSNKDDEIILGYLTWNGIHPFYKFIQLDIEYTVPYGIWYRKTPSPKVKKFVETVKRIQF